MEEFIVSTIFDGKKRKLFPLICGSSDCGKVFYVPKHRKAIDRCCSLACSNDRRYKASRITVFCTSCEAPIIRTPSKMKYQAKMLPFCSRKCKDEAQRLNSGIAANRPPHFGTGKGKHNYREVAIEAHGAFCNRCKYDRYRSVLRVHHIDRDRKNGHPSNLEVLCSTCHDEEHYLAKDGRWAINKYTFLVEDKGI